MWAGEPWLYHSRLSAAMNLKLLAPREVVRRGRARLARGHAPIAAVEGFVRQVLGWREYVRGIYWLRDAGLPRAQRARRARAAAAFYWTGETDRPACATRSARRSRSATRITSSG
jgi:deoxyribodipyrimidine photolyase-related protein